MKGNRDLTKHILVAPALLIFLAITIFPLLFTLLLSFSKWQLGTGSFEFVGIDNFKKALSDMVFLRTLVTTIVIVIAAVAIEYILGFLLALTVNKVIKGKRLIRILILLPMMLPPVVIGFMWKMLFDESHGPINYVLNLLGIPPINWITNTTTALASVILVDIWEWTPLIALILLAGLQSLPKEPYESSRVDGASEWRIFKDLTFPLLVPASCAAILLRSIETFKIFDTIYVITAGGPGISTTTSTIYAYTVGLRTFDLSYGATTSIIILVVVTIISTLFAKLFMKKKKRTAIHLQDEVTSERGVQVEF